VLCFLYSTAVVGRVLPRHRSLGIAWTVFVSLVSKNPNYNKSLFKSSQVEASVPRLRDPTGAYNLLLGSVLESSRWLETPSSDDNLHVRPP
jgi:hypothetical protein